MDVQFKSPWNSLARLITAVVYGALIVITLFAPLAAGPLGAILLVASLLLYIRGYRVENGKIIIVGLLWRKTYDLAGLVWVSAIPYGTAGSIRMLGSGGYFGYLGFFRSPDLGIYTSYMTDPANAVLLEFVNSRVVLSPDDPLEFVRAVEEAYSRVHHKGR